MIGALVFLLIILALLAAHAQRQDNPPHAEAAANAWQQLRPLIIRIPLALVAAGFLAALIPEQRIVALLGPDSGAVGILLASAIGGLLPGGPMVAFPLALVAWEGGAGAPQMVALITAWSVLALHRVLIFELPILGGRFATMRLAVSLVLPVLAGMFTAAGVALMAAD